MTKPTYMDDEFKEFLEKIDDSTPKHIQNELIRCYLMEKALQGEFTENIKEVSKVADDLEYFVYDDDNFSYDFPYALDLK